MNATEKKSLLITGGSGFIGSHLLKVLNPKKYRNIYCLARTETPVLSDLSKYPNVTVIKGGLFDTDIYKEYLESVDIAIHLAAITGKARQMEYFEVNTRGTEVLIDQCKRANVRHFLYVSSIAVKFHGVSRYHYAQSKQLAERIVHKSAMNYTILRPTIVLGAESPIWQNFLRLGKSRFPVVFGNGETKIQPVYIDDLIEAMILIIDEAIFLKEAYDLGGSEVISIEDFIRRIHSVYREKEPRVIHVPLRYLVLSLQVLEKPFHSVLPVTSGQLSSFCNDGVAEENKIFRGLSPKMRKVDDMLELLKADVHAADIKKTLNNECKVFCKYLINEEPTDYILEKYYHGNMATIIAKDAKTRESFGLVSRIARTNTSLCKLVDVYTSIFLRSSIFRKKTVLLMAILECCSPAYCCFDVPDSNRKSVFYFRVFQKGITFLFFFVISSLMFAPLHLAGVLSSGFSKN